MASVLLACPACKKRISSSAHSCPNCGEQLSDEWEETGRKELKRRRIGLRFLLASVSFATGAVIFGINTDPSRHSAVQTPITSLSAAPNDAKALTLPSKPVGAPERDVPFFTKLEAIFVGQPSQAEIKRSMDQVLASFRQPSSEENYKILGNVLVRMRKETPGATEMSILRCMLGLNDSLNQDFVAGAAICAVSLGR